VNDSRRTMRIALWVCAAFFVVGAICKLGLAGHSEAIDNVASAMDLGLFVAAAVAIVFWMKARRSVR
jgi:hypothetical protein